MSSLKRRQQKQQGETGKRGNVVPRQRQHTHDKSFETAGGEVCRTHRVNRIYTVYLNKSQEKTGKNALSIA